MVYIMIIVVINIKHKRPRGVSMIEKMKWWKAFRYVGKSIEYVNAGKEGTTMGGLSGAAARTGNLKKKEKETYIKRICHRYAIK